MKNCQTADGEVVLRGDGPISTLLGSPLCLLSILLPSADFTRARVCHPKEKQIQRRPGITIKRSRVQIIIQKPRCYRLCRSPVCSPTFVCVSHCAAAAAESSFGPN
ncbi:hypothetical protein F2P81_002640 [Scophthalmus maximus]|uniref:Uncharacterized protein n=1 Tax=Scophthalmus maximus TaxID=52904 RepID=A0A6A4TTT9_SCOMX|nr:hypothetical protein F2P81_002640 [Scophthalmus maximus]